MLRAHAKYFNRIHSQICDYFIRIGCWNFSRNTYSSQISRILTWDVIVSKRSRHSFRRPHPNLMKLSGFVELFSLIILLKKVFFNLTLSSLIYSWNTFTNFCHFFCVFLQENIVKWCRKTDETLSFVSEIINPMAYSDFSWKTASESTGVQNIFSRSS